MGSDNLHHHKKAKDFSRKKQRRKSYERVLIVCEGSKTEPNYFRDLITCLALNTANVEVDGNSDSSPCQIIKYAEERYKADKKTGDKFDRVFCVFDKDSHHSYKNAINKINNMRPKGVYRVINSVPCFEYWLLLHFEYTTKPYECEGKRSSCDVVTKDLKKFLVNYKKNCKGVYSRIKDKMNDAICNSKKSLKSANINDTDNPTTQVHELVEYLQNIKNN